MASPYGMNSITKLSFSIPRPRIPAMIPTSTPLLPQTLALISHPSTRVFFLASKPYPGPPRSFSSFPTTRSPPLLIPISAGSNEGSSVSVPLFEDLVEKDWSFVDSDTTISEQERAQKASRIISAADIGEKSRVLVSFGTEGFVDQLVESCPCELLLVVHDSLFVLAGIKEKYDKVRCFQGGIEVVPEKFAPFDVVLICYFPGMGVSIDRLLGLLSGRCSPGARLVISYHQGREAVEKVHRQQHPDMVTSDLPCKITLENAASRCSFRITEIVDGPSFYLAVLKFCESETAA